MTPQNIRQLILARMAALGLTRGQLARLVAGRISRTHLYEYLGGKKRMSDDKIAVILEILGLRIVAEGPD